MFGPAGAHAAEATQRYHDSPILPRRDPPAHTRFIDDAVREGIATGLRQLVILGAGFDMRGLRMREVADQGE